MSRLVTWTLTVAGFLVAGWLAGILLDAVLWHVSYDYVYRPHQFAESGVRWAGLLGTAAAAAATLGTRAPVPRRGVTLILLIVSLATLAGAVLLAGGGAALIKLHLLEPPNEHLIPLARVWFCEGLWRGAAVGSAIGVICGCRRIWRQRAASREQRAEQ